MRAASLAFGLLLPLACFAPAQAVEAGHNPVQSPPGAASGLSVMRPFPGCGPGSTLAVCQAQRNTVLPSQPVAARPLSRTDDIKGTRFVPPAIQRFLADRRLDPYTRALLRGLAAKPTEQWTQGELQTVTQLVPSLTEMAIPIRVLRDVYEFLGLKPNELFEPQLGNWQTTSSGYDARNYDAVQQAQCLYLLGNGETIDPSSVVLKDLAACAASGDQP